MVEILRNLDVWDLIVRFQWRRSLKASAKNCGNRREYLSLLDRFDSSRGSWRIPLTRFELIKNFKKRNIVLPTKKIKKPIISSRRYVLVSVHKSNSARPLMLVVKTWHGNSWTTNVGWHQVSSVVGLDATVNPGRENRITTLKGGHHQPIWYLSAEFTDDVVTTFMREPLFWAGLRLLK